METAGQMSIGEVARRAGLQPSAIRYYERVGLLPPPARRSGRRRYEPGVLDRLALIHLAQDAGLTLAEIRELISGFPVDAPPGERWRTLASRKLREIDESIARAERMRKVLLGTLDCECATLDACPHVDWSVIAGSGAMGRRSQ